MRLREGLILERAAHGLHLPQLLRNVPRGTLTLGQIFIRMEGIKLL